MEIFSSPNQTTPVPLPGKTAVGYAWGKLSLIRRMKTVIKFARCTVTNCCFELGYDFGPLWVNQEVKIFVY